MTYVSVIFSIINQYVVKFPHISTILNLVFPTRTQDLLHPKFAFMSDHPICSCDGSTFIYQPAGHIVTDNVYIIGNSVLEDFLTKGPKNREPWSFSWIFFKFQYECRGRFV